MWAFKDHGKSYEVIYERTHPPGFRWLHESFGTNWRMLEIQAVIGRIQLRKMPAWTAARRHNAKAIYDALHPFLSKEGMVRCPFPGETHHAFYKFYFYVRPENLAPNWNRNRIIEEINTRGVPCYQGSCSEVYLEKAFDKTAWRPTERLPVAKELGETS